MMMLCGKVYLTDSYYGTYERRGHGHGMGKDEHLTSPSGALPPPTWPLKLRRS